MSIHPQNSIYMSLEDELDYFYHSIPTPHTSHCVDSAAVCASIFCFGSITYEVHINQLLKDLPTYIGDLLDKESRCMCGGL